MLHSQNRPDFTSYKEFLELKYHQYNHPGFIDNDPVSIPHRFKKKEDIEISGFLTATIAWGKRKTIINNALSLIQMMDDAPYDFIMYAEKKDFNRFSGFTHRTFNGIDCITFLKSLQHIYRDHGGIENCFKAEDIKQGIIKFRNIFFSHPHALRAEKHLANPAANSSAKRINMFLRWMVRSNEGGIDFGIWKVFQPYQLYCPLDIHTGTVARKLTLLLRRQNDWKAVEELTKNLRILDPDDPVRFDIALFGLGILEEF